MADLNLGIDGISDVAEVGRGGSARVYRARQLDLDRTVAVKVLQTSWDEAVQRRFNRERQAMGRLSDHVGIVDVFHSGTTTNGEPFIIMPFFAAGSLDDQLVEGPMDWQAAVKTMISVAETMADAHASEVIHRDLKPANILMTESGEPRVADFGISRLRSAETASQSSSLTFTPAYSPPEAFTTAPATPAADVYGLGATLWALLAGQPPFTDPAEPPNVLALMNSVANEEVTAPSPETPPAITAVIRRAMAKLPEHRYADAAEFRRALAEAAGNPTVPPAVAPVQTVATSSDVRQTIRVAPAGDVVPESPEVSASKARVRIAAVSAAVLAVVAAGSVAWATNTRSGIEEPESVNVLGVSSETTTTSALTTTISPESDQFLQSTAPSSSERNGAEPTLIESTTTTNQQTTQTTRNQARRPETTPQQAEPTVPPTLPTSSTTSTTQSTTTTSSTEAPDPNPLISNLRVSDLTPTSGIVGFTADQCTGVIYEFSNGGGSQRSGLPGNDDCWFDHFIQLGSGNLNIQSGQTYTVTVTVINRAGLRSTRSTSFEMPAKSQDSLPPPNITALSSLVLSATDATIQVSTDQCTTLSIRLNNGGGLKQTGGGCSTTHTAQLAAAPFTIRPGETFFVTVTAINESGIQSERSISVDIPAN